MSLFGRFGKLYTFRNEIKWFFQRGIKGYCEKDLWELNNWFATTFSRMLKEFGEDTLDYPPGFPDLPATNLPEGSLNSNIIGASVVEEDFNKFLAWKVAIKEAANQFAATKNDCAFTPSLEAKASCNRAFEFLRKYYFDLWCLGNPKYLL